MIYLLSLSTHDCSMSANYRRSFTFKGSKFVSGLFCDSALELAQQQISLYSECRIIDFSLLPSSPHPKIPIPSGSAYKKFMNSKHM